MNQIYILSQNLLTNFKELKETIKMEHGNNFGQKMHGCNAIDEQLDDAVNKQ